MVRCPLCGRAVGQRYPVPPEVITPEMVDVLSDTESLSDLRLCAECIHRLMEGESTPGLMASSDRIPGKTEPR